jgi:hypothetical protein
MKKFYITLAFGLLMVSCNKEEGPIVTPGTYTGTFQRITDGVPGKLAKISIHFTEDNKFLGSSSEKNYPAINYGTFYMMTDAISFSDKYNRWPANFDWTLIINGMYDMQTIGDSLYIRTQVSGTDIRDVMSLERRSGLR